MINIMRNLSLVPKRLHYKTMIAFCLMSLIPLLICVWLATNYIFPNIDIFPGLSLGNISFILAVSLIISMLGLYLAKEMIDPVIKIAGDAKVIAGGDLSRVIDVVHEDEIGDLGISLNIMTQKIKENLEELKAYSERTRLINLEINKKVVALSGLLQIGNLISSSTELQTVFNFIIEKVSDVEDGSGAFLMLLDEEVKEFKVVSSANVDTARLQGFRLKEEEIVPRIVVVDDSSPARSGVADKLLALLQLRNIVLLPVIGAGKYRGIFVVANRKEDFAFKDDEKELLKVFVKQTSIAVENALLIKKARESAITDGLTGLHNENFICTRLDEEIKRACLYQRPCGYILVDIDNFKNFQEKFREPKTVVLLKAMAELLKGSVTQVDMVGRLAQDRFAIILPERNKKQAASIAEEIRKRVQTELDKIMRTSEGLTVSIGVSENPIDGSSADELMEKAELLLKKAKSLGKNRVEV